MALKHHHDVGIGSSLPANVRTLSGMDSLDNLTGRAARARPYAACSDGPAVAPMFPAPLFLLGFLVDVLMSCSMGTAMESSKALNRSDVGTGGLDDTHGHDGEHDDDGSTADA